MTIFKSTYEVLNCPWEEKCPTQINKIPPSWKEDKIEIDNVVIWEQVYHQPGNVGIYVAWSPMAEFYLIVYDLFSKTSAGIKTFSGPDAIPNILALAKKLNIELPVNRLQV
jgi:hypothetical protein